MIHLSDRDWKPFLITNIFSEIERGKRIKKSDQVNGSVPYVSSTGNNNGVDGFIEATNGTRVFRDCISIANSGSVGSAFYEPFSFVASDHVTHLKQVGLTKYHYLFIISLLEMQKNNFNFNREINDRRLLKFRIMLPVNDKGEPDYQFMEDYISELMMRKRQQYKHKLNSMIKELIPNGEIELTISNKIWEAVPITQLFQKLEPGKGKGLNHLKKCKNGIPYIGATNRNNGVVCFVEDNENSHKMIQQGNCIGFIKNGDGSAGFAIYRKEPFISTSDVIFGYASWLSIYTGLFFVAAQDMIEQKYSHGYKRNKEHLRGDRVMLPVTTTGEPDYAFMEQYGKALMAKKYKQYLDYLESKKTV